ncbi:ATP-binding protein [Chelatococcus reniformis]|uniref:3-methylcrotonyl-CoA carboxylase subunit alpha n=1 Tax=Chelatococcus reniformis TaxID=1494448 RepID=A0A916U231_9HYPH|nr:biotin carboxylase N-terminal domain-containing protein [Chelatococcus reniformis]GGC57456.1 3-methylcrotonyl-CoA carboxylase subunit alpha [Chelatococcus reniformis]
MFESVLIANRGEIACRIIRTARELGMRTIAVHSDVDSDALFVRQADEAVLIGPAPAAESYLVIGRIIEAAKASGAQCIHPGYGFLSERAEFADACAAAGVTLVGPPAAAMRAMGLKDAAKALAERAGVPVVPGYHGQKQEAEFLRQKAYEVGYPVLIKAIAGGGGKGMRRVDKASDFDAALEGAQREAQSAFGDARVLVEKYILAPRHVEIQVFADTHGNVVHLFERDCSLQRRHQKVIEEAPAPGMTAEVREAMGKAAVEAARAVGYVGAGTVEFIADGREGLKPDRFYFMEMNTRLQVEHPVTEAITGLDLVELQFRVAAGDALPFSQEDLRLHGHAVEARLYAEDPEKGFLPSTGQIWLLDFPEVDGVRIDSGVESGGRVSPFYDPMLAKIIAHAPTRGEALDRLAEALGDTLVAGPKTNLAFLKRIAESHDFRAGRFDTGYIDARLDELGAVEQPPFGQSVAAAALMLQRQAQRGATATPAAPAFTDPWASEHGFQLLGERHVEIPLLVDGERDAAAQSFPDGRVAVSYKGAEATEADLLSEVDDIPAAFGDGTIVIAAGRALIALRDGRQVTVAPFDPFAVDLEHIGEAGGTVKSPMHGKVVAILVAAGEAVTKGQRLAVVEAMKMEHALVAPRAGTVADVRAAAGQQVAEGAPIVVLHEDE